MEGVGVPDPGFLERCLGAGCSPDLAALLDAARSHALVALRRRGTPLPPMVLVRRVGGTEVREFAEGSMESAAFLAQEFIRSLDAGARMYAVVLDSLVTVEGTDIRNQDALLVEGAERGQPHGFRFAQRYRKAHLLRKLEPVGEFELLGVCAQLMEVR